MKCFFTSFTNLKDFFNQGLESGILQKEIMMFKNHFGCQAIAERAG
jgi:hypothetical protein